MREILFRAKSIDYGEWKVGGIYQEPKNEIKEGNEGEMKKSPLFYYIGVDR